MNVAILGKSQINSKLKEKLEDEGFKPLIIENIDDITSFCGEKTDFTISAAGNKIEAGYVIVTEEQGIEQSFNNIDEIAGKGNPIVFILDYPEESPAYLTVEALESAIRLARRKKQVLYFSKYMRTAGNHVESLFKEARNAGVSFIKYQDLVLNFDRDSGIYHISAADGYDVIKIDTPSVISAQTASSDRINKIVKILSLKRNTRGLVNGDQSFLFPALTSRNGVYLIDSSSFTSKEEVLDRIQFIISEIKNDTCSTNKNKKYAEINSSKCAFCYTCFRACPHSAMASDYENSVMKNLKNACQACGICVSVCPANAVSIAGDAADDDVVPNTLKILCCENSGELAALKLENEFKEMFDRIEIKSVSCGGELSVESILTTLKQYEKVLVLTCMDDACRHFEGNKRAERFVEKAKGMLKASGLNENRVECLKISHPMQYILKDQIEEML
ncbi:MAG: methyl-viologen-reducing hydrogenase delta subunit [Clostridiales bacterium]|nr:methyl-viologen-reducing hydrogenase delta subunit [Clostridiales bacterium]